MNVKPTVQMFPAETACELLTDDGIATLLMAAGYQGPEMPFSNRSPDLLQSLLVVLCNCGSKGRSSADASTIVEMHSMVLALQEHEDEQVRELAAKGAQLFD